MNIGLHDVLLTTSDKQLYIIELIVGYETNFTNNVNRKKAKYKDLITQVDKNFLTVKFVNLSVSSLGVFDEECRTFLEMLNDLRLDKRQPYCIKKMISTAIRSTYYVFCCRNKEWSTTELMFINFFMN